MDPLLYTRDEETVKTMDESAPDEPAPKKAKIVKSAGKVTATVFWGARDIIHIDYLPSKQTINDDYYAALLDRFNNILKKKTSPFGEEESALPMHGFTRARHQLPNSTNSATNCFPIQHIRRI